MAPMYAACHAALSTAELLESILLQVRVKHILLVQRVSKQWRNTIIGSLQLQRALFLKPLNRDHDRVDTKDRKCDEGVTQGPHIIINPLLRFIGRTRRWGNDPVDVRFDLKILVSLD
ncbi:hypothetical protein AC579_8818 [Pseudocercospora musae]|uniref:F-box domain-containing protein n=1 Tax=Pseudocercospora musae TaxID=113226 RepID=A0A139I5D5_9PEZI|nr:hypothetical protein AC579_8818 [Pseudocercospora musae]